MPDYSGPYSCTLTLRLLFRQTSDAQDVVSELNRFANELGKAPLGAFSPDGLVIAVTGGEITDVKSYEVGVRGTCP